jgi:hypothetical protein
MRDTAATLAWLRDQHDHPTQSWYRLCLGVTRQARGIDGLFPRAYDAWVGAKQKHPLTPTANWHDVPRGAPVFYHGPIEDGVEYGHIVTFFGVTQAGPLVWSNDVVAQGKMNMVSPLWFLSHWGHTLLGWTGDLNGVDLHLTANGPGSGEDKGAAPAATVSVASVVAAAKADPGRPQGHRTKDALDDVLPVEKALVKLGWLPADLADGAFGTSTVSAYQKWQQSLGYTGKDADGIPGEVSLSRLGAEFGFRVTA